MKKSTEEMMNEILKNSEEELSFEEIIEKNKGNINEEKINSEIAKIGQEPEKLDIVITGDDCKFAIDDDSDSLADVILEEINSSDKIAEVIIEEDVNEEIQEEIEEPIDEYENIYSDSSFTKGNIDNVNKKKMSKIAKRGIAILTVAGIAIGIGTWISSCNKKGKNIDNVKPSTTITNTNPTESTTLDELGVEVEINTKPIPTIKGEIDSKNVVIDKNGTAWASKEDASKAPKNGDKDVEVESGYLAPDGNVYESKEDYEKLIKTTKSTTKITEKKVYYATDGTAFESKKDRDAWNAVLKTQNSTTKKYYEASDGTLFESEKDRDAYNAVIKTQNLTTKQYFVANDGTYFETKEDMEAWNAALKQQETTAVQQNSYNSRQQQITELKQMRSELVVSNLNYEQPTTKTLSL